MDASHLLPMRPPIPRTDIEKSELEITGSDGGRVRERRSGILNTRPRKSSRRKTLVLCFDGTGNQFHGDASDSNILKIFRMLDRNGSAFHYYQPGIGTYVQSDSLSSHSSLQKLKSWYTKAKDSAVGVSFDQHVVGGYKFLMRYYSAGDNIYMFGFSRGSYTARFLAEMIDWVGLISHGNEEMVRFAWKTFSKWKAIDSYSEEAMKDQKKAYDFMVSFRETFSRPVRRIRFLGLFDTVNSVPRFENAMMGRPHMPYTARSSAKVIRHAVSIDERRAKFRSDLISDEGRHQKETDEAKAKHMAEKANGHFHLHSRNRYKKHTKKSTRIATMNQTDLTNGTHAFRSHRHIDQSRYRVHSRSRTPSRASRPSSEHERNSADDHSSILSAYSDHEYSSDSDGSDQDIDEIWFPGGHADIGGGWMDVIEEDNALSHVPLVWIVREAKRSGLQFDQDKMKSMHCWDDSEERVAREAANVPAIEITGGTPLATPYEKAAEKEKELEMDFQGRIINAATKGRKHDCLAFNQGLPHGSVLSWRIMEYMPFRRMDLRDDGSWKPIRWPLPRGEVRDMPAHAKVHHSAIRRMKDDPSYRPGNLIIGGGGRGMIIAPEEAGIGEWEVVGDEGDIVGERFIRVPRQAGATRDAGVKSGCFPSQLKLG